MTPEETAHALAQLDDAIEKLERQRKELIDEFINSGGLQLDVFERMRQQNTPPPATIADRLKTIPRIDIKAED
jgi:hypothetical protein